MASSALSPETRSRATTCSWVRPGEVLLGLVELALAVEQLAVALLEHLRPLVQLLVALGEASFLGGELVASGPRLLLRLAGEPELLVLGLEDQFLLAGARLGLDAAGLGLGGLHALGCPHRPDQRAEQRSAEGGDQAPPPPRPVCPSVSSHPDRIVRPDASRMRRHDHESEERRGAALRRLPRREPSDGRSGPLDGPRSGRFSFGTPLSAAPGTLRTSVGPGSDGSTESVRGGSRGAAIATDGHSAGGGRRVPRRRARPSAPRPRATTAAATSRHVSGSNPLRASRA